MTKMNKKERVAKSYNRTIELSKEGFNQYTNLPTTITSMAYYEDYLCQDDRDSGNTRIKEYLDPNNDMLFIDLGCCFNLIEADYDQWKSLYYGVDISSQVIDVLKNYIRENSLCIGGVFLEDMINTHFADNMFDIGSCIGSLEYYEANIVEQAILEISRILKKHGKFVLDIPDITSKEYSVSRVIEEYLGRKDDFNLSEGAFEKILTEHFIINAKQYKNGTVIYYIEKK